MTFTFQCNHIVLREDLKLVEREEISVLHILAPIVHNSYIALKCFNQVTGRSSSLNVLDSKMQRNS